MVATVNLFEVFVSSVPSALTTTCATSARQKTFTPNIRSSKFEMQKERQKQQVIRNQRFLLSQRAHGVDTGAGGVVDVVGVECMECIMGGMECTECMEDEGASTHQIGAAVVKKARS